MFQRRPLPVFLSEMTIYLVIARFTLIGLIKTIHSDKIVLRLEVKKIGIIKYQR
jgi:hypothetical protein